MDLEGLVIIGRILKPHGIHGEARVWPETDFPERFSLLRRVLLVQGEEVRELEVEGTRPHGRYVLIKFKGLEAPEEVRAVAGAWLAVPKQEALPLPSGHYYIHQVVGLRVVTEGGVEVGRVVEVMRSPAHDIYVVRADSGEEILLPAIHEVVKSMDVEAGRMIVTLPGEE